MQYVITSIFCYVDDFLKDLSLAEIITISLTASRYSTCYQLYGLGHQYTVLANPFSITTPGKVRLF